MSSGFGCETKKKKRKRKENNDFYQLTINGTTLLIERIS